MYYKITDEYVYKYDVILNIKKLHDIKNEIIDKCSFISHKRYKTKNPSKPNMVNCRNYKKTKINDCEYLIEYDCLEIPMLVNYIIDLLSGKFFVIDKIINYEENMNNLSLEEKQLLKESERIINLLTNKSIDTNQILNLLSENHKKLLENKKSRDINKKRKSSSNYVKEVLSCITFKEVECVKKNNMYKEINEILNPTESNFCKNLTKETSK